MSDYTASAAEVKALREATGAGIMECKNALRRARATRTRPSSCCASAASPRPPSAPTATTTEGLDRGLRARRRRIGALVEIGCETDFVAGTDDFKTFAHEVALQISASRTRAGSAARTSRPT